jgi:hypothetical protein
MVAMSGGTPIPEQIDAIVAEPGGWRSAMLAHLRDVIRMADPSVVEDVKWKKLSRPMGVPVWCRDGNLCIGEALKNAVRLTFPKAPRSRTGSTSSTCVSTATRCELSTSMRVTGSMRPP